MTMNPHNRDLGTPTTTAPPSNMTNSSVMSPMLSSNDTIMKNLIMISNTGITKRLFHPRNVLQDHVFNISMVMRMLTGILQMEGKAKDMIHNNERQHIHVLPPHYAPTK